MSLFSTTFSLNGQLKRWGIPHIEDILLCQRFQSEDTFHRPSTKIFNVLVKHSCSLTLRNIIDMAILSGNDNFITMFVNFTQKDSRRKNLLQSVPILIKNITSANNVRLQLESINL